LLYYFFLVRSAPACVSACRASLSLRRLRLLTSAAGIVRVLCCTFLSLFNFQ